MAESFKSFLEGYERERHRASDSDIHEESLPVRTDQEVAVLRILDEQGPQDAARLMEASGLPFVQFSEVLIGLKSGLLVSTNDDVVEITTAGRQLL